MNPRPPTRRLILVGGLISGAVGIASYRPAPDPSWKAVTSDAPWAPRDNAGLVIHENRIWLIGGTPAKTPQGLSDCWSSAEGLTWTKELDQAPWSPTVQSMVIAFAGRLWRMGGFYQDGDTFAPVAEIWSSQDGRSWTRAGEADWSPRGGGALVSFSGRLWLLGGTRHPRNEGTEPNFNDVWVTDNGTTWTQVVQNAPWQARAFHNAVVHEGQIWILGGGYWGKKAAAYQDVWCSPDGRSWTRKTAMAEWPGRIWSASASFRGALWSMGGLVPSTRAGSDDIWYSKDGAVWYPYLSKMWVPRMAHSALVFSDRLWVVAGSNFDFLHDVWALDLPTDWTGESPFSRTWRFLLEERNRW
ncbi:hypothetical protein SAMN05216525_109149 [Bradyrhizobium sp. Gha]|nr:hypothetical protein SAMN05216525_109149 [Bradyrhizobium sp. Gha]